MHYIVILLALVLIISLFRDRLFQVNFEQFGGKINYENNFLMELRDDHDKYFKYSKGTFTYLDNIQQTYEDNLTLIKNRQKKIQQIINDYDKTTKLLVDLGNANGIKPLYSDSDLKRKEIEMNTNKDLYNEHLNTYLTLSNLNNQLLLLHIYSKNENISVIDKLKEEYRKNKKVFQKNYRDLVKKSEHTLY